MNKKIFAGILSALICLCPMNFTSINAYSFTKEEISSSEITPVLSFPEINIPINRAKENPEVSVSLTLSGANRKYSTADIWTSFDSRLSLKKDSETEETSLNFGNALKNLKVMVNHSMYYDMAKESIVDLNGIRIIAAGGGNVGLDGVVFTATVILPDNVEEGDVFELKTVRVTRENSNNEFANSTFTNSDDDKTGRLMEEWLFTNGLKNGFIKITGEQEINYGDANLDGEVTVSDAVCILQYLANSEKYPLDGQAMLNADVYNTGDGVTARDASSIQKLDAGVIDSLPEI